MVRRQTGGLSAMGSSGGPRAPKHDPLSEKIHDPKQLQVLVSNAIDRLEKDLDNDAKQLRSALASGIEGISTSKPLPLEGFGMRFVSPSGERIELKFGEVDTDKGKEIMQSIIEKTIPLAREDLRFLNRIKEIVTRNETVSADDLNKVYEILNGNLYWRFTTPF